MKEFSLILCCIFLYLSMQMKFAVYQPSQDIQIQLFANTCILDCTLCCKCQSIPYTLCVCLQVHYPDQKSYLITPKKCHFTKLNPLQHKLISEVIISHSLWSGKNFRAISLGTCVDPFFIEFIPLCNYVYICVYISILMVLMKN